MSRILVTGGWGFIGSSLLRELVKHRDAHGLDLEIRAMDLIRPELPGVDCIQGSILDATHIAQGVRGCDHVVHLAALLGVRNSELRRLDCLNINIMGTVNVLNACVQDRVKKIVFSSSSEVYGDQMVLPIKETNPVNPKSVYAVSKLAGEEYVRAYAERFGMDFSILRFFNVYGPGQVGEFVVPRFIMAVQQGNAPVVYGDGQQRRAFCYAEDVARGIVSAIFSEKANGETINLGNDREVISMLDLARKVIQVSGQTHLRPELLSMKESDRSAAREIQERLPDIAKAKAILQYEPACTLEYGLRKMYEHGAIVPTWSR